MSKFTKAVERNTPPGTNLVCGWSDEAHGITHAAYLDWAVEEVENVNEGNDVPALMSFADWKKSKQTDDRDTLGFSHEQCDLCGALAGDRYAVTALPEDVSEKDAYIELSVCQDCLQYIANGEEPEDWE